MIMKTADEHNNNKLSSIATLAYACLRVRLIQYSRVVLHPGMEDITHLFFFFFL